MMANEIDWISITERKPPESGRYMVAVNPGDYKDCEDPRELNSWRAAFGCKIFWFHNGEFWEDHYTVSDRVTHWGYRPNVPLYTDNKDKPFS
jgi:hypothetical protein